MGSINSYRQYRQYFGFDLNKGTPSTGIVYELLTSSTGQCDERVLSFYYRYAIYTIGNIVGSFAAGPASDYKGMARKSRMSPWMIAYTV